jgi:hypothetical protein
MKTFRTLAILVCYVIAGCAATHVNPNPAAVTDNFGPLQPMGRVVLTRRPKDEQAFKNALYLARGVFNEIEIYSNEDYRVLGRIKDGIDDPVAESMDQEDNLYVANLHGGDITEYAPGGTSPSFTYNAAMSRPVAVTVDRHGNVYEADEDGFVNQYSQGNNTVQKACPRRRSAVPTALAVDSNGDVFVSYYSDSGAGGLFEFVGGLHPCNNLVHLNAMGTADTFDLATDEHNNLIAIGYPNAVGIYVIDPPYSSITRTIGGSYSLGISLHKNNKLLFSVYGAAVELFDYPTGGYLKHLNGSYGIYGGSAVVDAPNAVY